MTQPASGPPLQSWKEVAAFLGVSIRTAQYWEREKGLPVSRLPTQNGRVSANPEDLERWRSRNSSAARPFQTILLWRTYGVAATLALLVIGGHDLVQHFRQRPGTPVRFQTEQGALTAIDSGGRVVWNKIFPGRAESESYTAQRSYPRRRLWSGDVDADGRIETVYVPPPGSPMMREIICFSQDGKERWRSQLALRNPSNWKEGQSVVVTDIDVTPGPDHSAAIFVARCRLPQHHGVVACLDHDGRPVGALDFPGHVEIVSVRDVGGNGAPELLVGGFNTATSEALLIVADTQRMVPVRKFLFPRTCVNRLLSEANRVGRIGGTAESIEIGVEESFDHQPIEIVYRFARNFKPRSTWLPESFRELHKRFEAEGRLNHTLEQPESYSAREIAISPPVENSTARNRLNRQLRSNVQTNHAARVHHALALPLVPVLSGECDIAQCLLRRLDRLVPDVKAAALLHFHQQPFVSDK